MDLELVSTISESAVFKSDVIFNKFKYSDLVEFFYLYVLSMELLSIHDDPWVGKYASRTKAFNNFDYYRSAGTDLYMLAFVLDGNYDEYKHADELNKRGRFDTGKFKRFLGSIITRPSNNTFMPQYFYSLENQLRMGNGVYRIIRRNVLKWDHISDRDKEKTIYDIMYYLRHYAANAEILTHVKGLVGKYDV